MVPSSSPNLYHETRSQFPIICSSILYAIKIPLKIILLALRFFEWLPYIICLPFTGNPLRDLPQFRQIRLNREQAIQEIETLEQENQIASQFTVAPGILNFSPDSLYRQLSSYKFLDFTDLYSFEGETIVSYERQQLFEIKLSEVSWFCVFPQYRIARFSLSKLLHALELLKERALQGSDEQKRHFKDFVRSTIHEIGSHTNCVDQTLLRTETVLMNVSAELLGANQFAIQAGLALTEYETTLFSEIIRSQNPNEDHLADLQRELFKLFNKDHGHRMRSRDTFSLLRNHWPELNNLYQRALTQFQRDYKPLEFLLTAPATAFAPNASTRRLFIDICQWFTNHLGEYNTGSLDEPEIASLARTLMPAERRANYSDDADFTSNNGCFSKAAMTFCLHHTGILQRRP